MITFPHSIHRKTAVCGLVGATVAHVEINSTAVTRVFCGVALVNVSGICTPPLTDQYRDSHHPTTLPAKQETHAAPKSETWLETTPSVEWQVKNSDQAVKFPRLELVMIDHPFCETRPQTRVTTFISSYGYSLAMPNVQPLVLQCRVSSQANSYEYTILERQLGRHQRVDCGESMSVI